MQTPIKSRGLAALCLATSVTAAGGCADLDAPALETARAAVTTDDVDLPPECAGILPYLNTASLGELYSYLPNSLADALVARRATRAFDSLADISSVPGVAQGRLWSIYSHAVTTGFVNSAACVGVYEELGVSASDRTAILAYVNSASQAELERVARSQPATTAAAIVAARPYTQLQSLADTQGVGIETFRAIRNAAIDTPFDVLVDRVNAIHRGVVISTDFDVFTVAHEEPGQPAHRECFGVTPSFAASVGATLRPNLADSAEVYADVQSAVSWANRLHEISATTVGEGLSDLDLILDGGTFYGCYLDFEPDPWSGINRAFFVNTVTGYRTYTEVRWSE